MKTHIDKLMKGLLAAGLIVLGLGMLQKAHASGNPDTMTITVTPGTPNYAVAITSPELQGYDFGTVGISGTTVSTKAISVENFGNISEYFVLAVADITGSNPWTNATSPANATYTMQGLFQANQPATGGFSGATNNVPGTVTGNGASHFGEGTTQTAPLASQNLWLQLQMPTGIVAAGQHTLVLYVNGQSN